MVLDKVAYLVIPCQEMDLLQENVPQFMTLNEVAQRLHVSRWTINRWIKRKNNPLPVVYLTDRSPRIPWDQFEIWVKSIQEGGEKDEKIF